MFSHTGYTVQAADALSANNICFPKHGEVKRVGDKSVVLPLRLSSGLTLEIAVPPDLVTAAAGPFPVPEAAQQEIDHRAPWLTWLPDRRQQSSAGPTLPR